MSYVRVEIDLEDIDEDDMVRHLERKGYAVVQRGKGETREQTDIIEIGKCLRKNDIGTARALYDRTFNANGTLK